MTRKWTEKLTFTYKLDWTDELTVDSLTGALDTRMQSINWRLIVARVDAQTLRSNLYLQQPCDSGPQDLISSVDFKYKTIGAGPEIRILSIVATFGSPTVRKIGKRVTITARHSLQGT